MRIRIRMRNRAMKCGSSTQGGKKERTRPVDREAAEKHTHTHTPSFHGDKFGPLSGHISVRGPTTFRPHFNHISTTRPHFHHISTTFQPPCFRDWFSRYGRSRSKNHARGVCQVVSVTCWGGGCPGGGGRVSGARGMPRSSFERTIALSVSSY